MNTKGKITLVIILSVILVVCIAFAMVLTFGSRPVRVPTEQTGLGTEGMDENNEPISEQIEGESIFPQEEEETVTEAETEFATQAPTQPEPPIQPVTKPKEETDDTTPPPQIQPTEGESESPTEAPNEPTESVEGGQGNAEWGNAGAED